MSGAQLKALLGLNEQLKGGNKGELVARCVDRKLHGNLPRCPECGGGRLKHDGAGAFFCPGYYDDDEFVFCRYRTWHCERPAWRDS